MLTTATAVINPRSKARDKTTSRKPRRRRPRTLVITPIYKDWSIFLRVRNGFWTDLEGSDESDSSCFSFWVRRSTVRVSIHRFLDHLADQKRKSRLWANR